MVFDELHSFEARHTTFSARFDSDCYVCGDEISEGDVVCWFEDEVVIHHECHDDGG